MESGDPELEWSSISQPPPFVSLSPFPATVSPSPRRLSSCFTEPSRPIRAARKLAWVSLQGRIIGAEEASSAKTLASECGIVLDPKQAIAWELFSPIHRILIVAVISVAAANSKRNKQIFQLKKAVELRVSYMNQTLIYAMWGNFFELINGFSSNLCFVKSLFF